MVMRDLAYRGQTVWLDHMRRGTIRSGQLSALVADGVRGLMCNPTIFAHVAAGIADYDGVISAYAAAGATDTQIRDAIVTRDVQDSSDIFRQMYEETHGADGFVSIDISPSLISNAAGLVAEARRLWQAVDRPNVMIKIPGTERTWPAVERCLRDGINVNITLLFSPDHYRNAAGAYLRALESRVAMGEPIDRVASAASLFVSSVDSAIDRFITKRAALSPLRGLVAIANARLVYAAFIGNYQTARWKMLEARGAKPQRPLWVCTDTEQSGHSDAFCIDSVVTPGTITALSPDALADLRGHDFALAPDDTKDAQRVMNAIARGGISFVDVCRGLTDEGIWGFTRSMETLLGALAHRRKILEGHSFDFFG